jgi:hypothetical protein
MPSETATNGFAEGFEQPERTGNWDAVRRHFISVGMRFLSRLLVLVLTVQTVNRGWKVFRWPLFDLPSTRFCNPCRSWRYN